MGFRLWFLTRLLRFVLWEAWVRVGNACANFGVRAASATGVGHPGVWMFVPILAPICLIGTGIVAVVVILIL